MNSSNWHPDDETLDRLRAGLLEGAAGDEVRAHLDGCPRCQARARPWAALQGDGPVDGGTAAALAEARRCALEAAGRRSPGHRPWLAVAAAVVVAVGVGLLARLQPLQTAPEPRTATQVASADRELFTEIDFYVWLDQEAALTGRQETL